MISAVWPGGKGKSTETVKKSGLREEGRQDKVSHREV